MRFLFSRTALPRRNRRRLRRQRQMTVLTSRHDKDDNNARPHGRHLGAIPVDQARMRSHIRAREHMAVAGASSSTNTGSRMSRRISPAPRSIESRSPPRKRRRNTAAHPPAARERPQGNAILTTSPPARCRPSSCNTSNAGCGRPAAPLCRVSSLEPAFRVLVVAAR